MAKAVDLDDLEHTIEDIIANVCGRKDEGSDTEFLVWLRKLLHKKLDKWRPKLKFKLLYVYADDEPYLVINPPDNLEELMAEWNDLDRKWNNACSGGATPPDGMEDPGFVNDWLIAKGVELIGNIDGVQL